MTMETLKKANRIACTINDIERMYYMIKEEDCISLKSANGTLITTNDPVLIKLIMRDLLDRQSDLIKELDNM